MISSSVRFTEFDFHAVTREHGGIEAVKGLLTASLGDTSEELGACLISVGGEKTGASVFVGQRGVFRTNCKGKLFLFAAIAWLLIIRILDCLDRTNVVEDVLSRCAVEDFLRITGAAGEGSASLWAAHRTLFADVSPLSLHSQALFPTLTQSLI